MDTPSLVPTLFSEQGNLRELLHLAIDQDLGTVSTTCEGYLGQTPSLPVWVLCYAVLPKLPGCAVFVMYLGFEPQHLGEGRVLLRSSPIGMPGLVSVIWQFLISLSCGLSYSGC